MQTSTLSKNPVGIKWLISAQLAGMAKPGASVSLENDLASLQRSNVAVLISLTREWKPPVGVFMAYGMRVVHVPIKDMTPPTIQQAISVCETIDAARSNGKRLVIHCMAGKGRTGTLLACYKTWQGQTAAQAITDCRVVNPEWIETQGQLDFLFEFTTKLTKP